MELIKITEKIKELSEGDDSMEKFLIELFMYQRTSTGRWKDSYKGLVTKYAKVEDFDDEN